MTRIRTGIEGSRGFAIGGRLALTPSVELGLRQGGGDAETGTGVDPGGGLSFTDSSTGLSLDVQVRTLVAHEAEGFTDRAMSLSLGWAASSGASGGVGLPVGEGHCRASSDRAKRPTPAAGLPGWRAARPDVRLQRPVAPPFGLRRPPDAG